MATSGLRGSDENTAADVTETRAVRRLRVARRCRITASLTAAIASLALVGWLFDLELLKRIGPGLVAMNPLTAITFLLAASCLWFSSSRRGRVPGSARFRLVRGGAVLIAAIGAAKLLAIVFDLELHVDRLLFASKLSVGSATPNQMAPNAAFNFLLIGCAFLFLQLRNGRVSVWACIFALVSGFEALLALLGYAYGIESLYAVGSFIPMAAHTAFAFLLIAGGIMACQAQRGFLAVVLGRNAGGAMARRLLPAAILIPAVLGWLRLEGQRAGLYDSDFGVALYTVTSMVVFGAIVCCNALSLFRSDTARTKAERRLRGAYEGLERRVRERTAQLSDANAALLTAKDDLEARVGERTATLAESEARLNAILDNGTSIVYLKDLEDRYILVNRCFAKLLGRKKEEIVGRKTSELFPRDAAEQFRRSDLEALASGVALEVEESAHDADGLHTFVSTKFPLRDAAGEIYALCGVAYDITERRRTEEAINEQKQQLQAAVAANQLIMENSRDVICTIDDAGRFLTLSAATKALWGYEPAELIGRPYIDLVYPDDRAKTNDIAAQIVSGDAAHDFENRYVRKDGTLIDVMWSAYWSEADKLMFCVAHDITERTRVTRALKLAEQEANRANHAKSEFLSRMSHELRTPMNAILGFAQLLEMDKLTADQRDGIGHILRGGRHLLELINEVLDISRIEAGCLSLSPEPVEVGDALRETLDLLQPLASAREVRLNPAPDCASFVRADRQRLKQVLINLVSNAIKYNRLGGAVTIGCDLIDARLRISITDTGIGIPAERLAHLFVPFDRLGAEQSTVEGTGLGLAVAKRLVEAMEGTIGVQSAPGQGTTFWVEFLLTDSPLTIAELPQGDASPAVLPFERTQKVLYIEDNLSNLRLIERLLERRPGIQLLAAHEGVAGIGLAQQHRPELILLDVNLPDIDGHEVLRRLRADPQSASIPVIAISADATRGQIDRLMKAGARIYLTKPLDVAKFYDVLDTTLLAGA